MRLTSFTDYSLRMLIYLGLRTDRLVTIQSVATHYGISRNHLMKVAHMLVQAGYVASLRGKNGGLKLAMPSEDIVIGAVVRACEAKTALVECFDSDNSMCRIDGVCALKGMLGQAQAAFMNALDGYTLADVLNGSPALVPALFADEGLEADGDEERR